MPAIMVNNEYLKGFEEKQNKGRYVSRSSKDTLLPIFVREPIYFSTLTIKSKIDALVDAMRFGDIKKGDIIIKWEKK